MNTRQVATALFLGGVFTIAQPDPVLAEAPPYVQIRDVTYGGSGCPDGSVDVSIARNYLSFSLSFDRLRADDGPDTSASAGRKFCQVYVDFVIPSGWAFAVAGVEHNGYARLSSEVVGRQVSTYYFQGGSPSDDVSFTTELVGWYSGNYQREHQDGSPAWSSCGEDRAINLKAELQVNNRRNHDGYGTMMGTSGGSVTQVYGLRWRRC